MPVNRDSWESYFLQIAEQVACRATCPRRAVGAVIVRDRHILATGYNGAARGEPHCLTGGCVMVDGHCTRAVHAEANALVQAAAEGVAVKGADIYCTDSPCNHCASLLINAGVGTIYHRRSYDRVVIERLRRAGIAVIQVGGDEV